MFLYPDGVYDRTDGFKGLLQGELLVKVRKPVHILVYLSLLCRHSSIYTLVPAAGTRRMGMRATLGQGMPSLLT
jgi:hypothetical protein